MANRNRNRKRRRKELIEEEKKAETLKETKSNKNKEKEVTETPKEKEKEIEESTPKIKEEKIPKEKKKGGRVTQLLAGSFVVLFALPSAYYFTKIAPTHTAQIDRLTKENQVVTSENKVIKKELTDKLEKEMQNSEKVNKELLTTQTKIIELNEQLKANSTNEQEIKEELKKESQNNEKLKIELLATQTKITELEETITKEAKSKYVLQKQVVFLVTKGKELEDKFKGLQGSTSK